MPLTIIASDENHETRKTRVSKTAKRTKAKATLDRLYLMDPDQFYPQNDCFGRQRIERTMELIHEFITKNEKIAADLGTGSGVFAVNLSTLGLHVHAVDIAATPLKNLDSKNLPNIKVFQDYIPHTTLDSDSYDLVLGLDLIGYLRLDEYRLFFAELSRLVKPDGFVIVSTPIDIDSEDALENFVGLAGIEFNIKKWVLSYHSLAIRICRFVEAPAIFVKASKDHAFYEKELSKRFSINRALFKFNSSKIPAYFWSFIQLFTNPMGSFLKQNHIFMNNAEKICRFFSSETGVSHAIFVGTRKKLFEQQETPLELRIKQRIWE